jgi:hypothetical protein
MVPPTAQTQRAIALIDQLPPDKLNIAVTFLERLTQQTPAVPDNPIAYEISLRRIIQLRPTIDQARLDDLRDRNEWATLTDEEHQELIRYEEQLEQYSVDRLQAMIQLAQLKNIDLPTLNQQLKSEDRHAA